MPSKQGPRLETGKLSHIRSPDHNQGPDNERDSPGQFPLTSQNSSQGKNSAGPHRQASQRPVRDLSRRVTWNYGIRRALSRRGPLVTREGRIELLQGCSIMRGLTLADLRRILVSARVETVRKGGLLFRAGDQISEIYVLAHGGVKLVWSDPQGHEVITRFVRSGDAFGHVVALAGTASLVSAEAVENSEVLILSAETLVQTISRRPAAALNGLRLLARQILEGWRSFQMLATESVEQRIARTLLTLVQPTLDDVNEQGLVELRLSQQDIAELAGTTSFTVSRVMSHWKHLGIIALGRAKVTILRPRELAALVARDLDHPSGSPPGDAAFTK